MPVPRGGERAVFVEEVKLELVAVAERVGQKVEPAVAYLLAVPLFVELLFKFGKQREKVVIFIPRLGYPRKVVDAAGIGIYFIAPDVEPLKLFERTAQQLTS